MFQEINKLTKDEIKLFRKFVHSPYFNTYKTVEKLFDYLVSRYPHITKEDLNKKKISIRIYKQKSVNEIKIRKLLSDFNKLFNKFLTTIMLENDNSLKEMLLLRASREKLLTRKFNIQNNKVMKIYEKSFITNENIYSNMSQISEEDFYFMHEINDNKLIYAYGRKAMWLDYYIVYKKLRTFIEEIISEVYMVKKLKIEKLFYTEVLDFVEKNIEDIKLYHPYIYLNYLIVKFYENYEMSFLEMIKQYKSKKFHMFDTKLKIKFDDAIRDIYMKLFTKGKEDKGDEIKKELFDIFDRTYMHQPAGYYQILRSELKSYEFMVIVNLGCRLRKLEWTNSFINKYANSLSDEYTDDCCNSSLSTYYYTLKDFEKSIIYSNKVSNKIGHYFYTSKIRILISYCELNNDAGIISTFDNIKQYLKRNPSINSYDVQILKSFISFFSDFLKVLENIKNKTRAKVHAVLLIKKIENFGDTLYFRNWFIRKLKEI